MASLWDETFQPNKLKAEKLQAQYDALMQEYLSETDTVKKAEIESRLQSLNDYRQNQMTDLGLVDPATGRPYTTSDMQSKFVNKDLINYAGQKIGDDVADKYANAIRSARNQTLDTGVVNPLADRERAAMTSKFQEAGSDKMFQIRQQEEDKAYGKAAQARGELSGEVNTRVGIEREAANAAMQSWVDDYARTKNLTGQKLLLLQNEIKNIPPDAIDQIMKFGAKALTAALPALLTLNPAGAAAAAIASAVGSITQSDASNLQTTLATIFNGNQQPQGYEPGNYGGSGGYAPQGYDTYSKNSANQLMQNVAPEFSSYQKPPIDYSAYYPQQRDTTYDEFFNVPTKKKYKVSLKNK